MYARVACSSKSFCCLDSGAIGYALLLHDDLSGVTLDAAPVTDKQLKISVDGRRLGALTVELAPDRMPAMVIADVIRVESVMDQSRFDRYTYLIVTILSQSSVSSHDPHFDQG
jgi:hypothetical protein